MEIGRKLRVWKENTETKNSKMMDVGLEEKEI
jgi:hypothetical protein